MKREIISLGPTSPFNLSIPQMRLIEYFECRYDKVRSTADLDNAIRYSRGLVNEYYVPGHDRRDSALGKLESLLQRRYDAAGKPIDLISGNDDEDEHGDGPGD